MKLIILLCLTTLSESFLFPALFSNGNGNKVGDQGGGVGLFSRRNGGGNSTLIRVPIFVGRESNGTRKDQVPVPTSTSVTSSISSSGALQVEPLIRLVLEQTTEESQHNLFGLMRYMEALSDIKKNYKIMEKQRQIEFIEGGMGGGGKKSGEEFVVRVMRNLIRKVVNKYEKGTEVLRLKVRRREEKMGRFLSMPMVAGVMGGGGFNKFLKKN